jgi:hypothetical protein
MDFDTFLKDQLGYRVGQSIPADKIPILKEKYNRFVQETQQKQNEQKQLAARIQATANEFGVRMKQAQEQGFTPDPNVVNSISSLLGTGQVDEARKVFDNIMPKEQTQSDIKLKEEMKQAEATAKQESKEKGRLLGKLNKFVNENNEPTGALKDATGWGEGLATGVADWTGFIPLNTPKTRANQKQLSIILEKDMLEATKYLKPVSNDEMKMILERRPAITDPPEVWSTYLSELRDVIKEDENVVEIAPPEAKPKNADNFNTFFQGLPKQ